MDTIDLGAHLVSPRKGYTHHGIYAGKGLVIHYSGLADGLSAGPIEETSLERFSSGNDISIRKYTNPKYTGHAAIRRARSRLGESTYDIQGNNCEHFCSWVITGRSRSGQVDSVEDFLDILLPRSVILGIKTRKHTKQGLNPTDVGRDIVETAVVTTATTLVAAPLAPFYIGYKTLKWILRRRA
jgi:hypothetical protein